MKNILTRSLTGTAYVGLMSVGVIWNSYSFLALFSIIIILCLYEFYSLVNAKKHLRINPWYNCLGGLILFVVTFLFASGKFGYPVFSVYLVYVIAVLVLGLYEKQQDPVTHIAYTFFGQCYIALPFSVLNLIAFQNIGVEAATYNYVLVLSLLVFIWANDTGAYLIGITFGKHRLFERISPKKSWEGFWGGLGFAIITALIFTHFVPTIAWYHWTGMATIVVVFGTWGDLTESLIKRTLDVKDFGQSLPGHGGFLDRFDSLLLAIYAMLFYTQLFLG